MRDMLSFHHTIAIFILSAKKLVVCVCVSFAARRTSGVNGYIARARSHHTAAVPLATGIIAASILVIRGRTARPSQQAGARRCSVKIPCLPLSGTLRVSSRRAQDLRSGGLVASL